jgi:hypothetical protein
MKEPVLKSLQKSFFFKNYVFRPPPKILLITHIISASTITTTIMPDHTPALKMPSIAEQLAKVVDKKAKIARGKYLFIIIGFILD